MKRESLSGLLLVFLLRLDKSYSSDNNDDVETVVDDAGYVVYCPCMGRFGNQADQFLGAIAFAKKLNRTLVLPPWVEYVPFKEGSTQVSFSRYFKVKALEDYHKVILMEEFMDRIAPAVWPAENRIVFCYKKRGETGCDAKSGNPFGPFWDRFEIDFVGSEEFSPLTYSESNSKVWSQRYPSDSWPVLAFVGPPSPFPVEEKNKHLQKYLKWSEEVDNKAKEFIKSLPRGPFIGIHLRNGIDWSRACELVDESSRGTLFSSAQCTGYRNEKGHLKYEMCFPSINTILQQVKNAVEIFNASSVFVASDKSHLIHEIEKALRPNRIYVTRLSYNSPHVDLAVLGKSNLFIGNCVSSFSAFVKRERDTNGFPSEFWSIPDLSHLPSRKKLVHSEL